MGLRFLIVARTATAEVRRVMRASRPRLARAICTRQRTKWTYSAGTDVRPTVPTMRALASSTNSCIQIIKGHPHESRTLRMFPRSSQHPAPTH